MSEFLRGQLKLQQIYGTPQRLASSRVSLHGSVPEFQDPDDALRAKMVLTVQTSYAAWIDKYQQCLDKNSSVENAFAMANAEFVDGVRQHEISRNYFRETAVTLQRELEGLLVELRALTISAHNQWKDLLFLLPGPNDDLMKIANWCESHNYDSEWILTSISLPMYFKSDFGLSRESFLAEEVRLENAVRAGFEVDSSGQ